MFLVNASENWTSGNSDEDCYMCSKSNLIHVLFRRKTAEQDFTLVTNQKVKKTIMDFYDLKQYSKRNKELPVVVGSLTGWNPVKLVPLLYHAMLRLTKSISKNQSDIGKKSVQMIKKTIQESLNA